MSENQYDTCVIGAGPAGLAVARALAERDLPYTHIERHTGPGGLWDIDNPGSPMYESAHFISSKTLSGFGGCPIGFSPDLARAEGLVLMSLSRHSSGSRNGSLLLGHSGCHRIGRCRAGPRADRTICRRWSPA